MERDLAEEIARADTAEIEKLLKAVLQRYAVLFPDWEVGTISLQKALIEIISLTRSS